MFPKDREFFFNILNTLRGKVVEKLVYNAILQREKKKDIPDEIEVAPEFRDIFTDKYSLIGNKGKMINSFRKEHKKNPNKYRGRKKFNLKY